MPGHRTAASRVGRRVAASIGASRGAMGVTHQLGRPVLWMMVLVACTAGAVAAAGSRRPCLRSCGSEQRACRGLARTHAGALRAACTGAGGSRASCRRAARTIVRRATTGCRRLRKDCRACCRAGGAGPVCPIGHPVAFDPPPPPDLAAARLPRLPDGQFVVLVIPGAQLLLDPTRRDPVTALGACTGWITSCVEPAGRSLDDCARSAPPCATDRPWEEAVACCPAACFEAYQQGRRAGTDALAAFAQVYFQEARCFPGVQALLAGAGS